MESFDRTRFEKTKPILNVQRGVKPYTKGDYGENLVFGSKKNKPKQSRYYGSWFVVHSKDGKDDERLFEKTKPICRLVNRHKVLLKRNL